MVITRTPFRMSFFGGGTDFPEFYRLHGGSVLSATFDKYCYVTLRALPHFFSFESEFVYSRIERVNTVEEIQHPAIREAMRWQNVHRVRLSYEADLPARSGLGTSSAFAVGMMHAIHAARGEQADAQRLSLEAIRLERELCAEAGGVQDQIAAAYGGFNRIDFSADGFSVHPVPITAERRAALSERLLLFFTGVSRFSADLQVAHRSALRDKTERLMRMRALVTEAEALLRSDAPLRRFGELLDAEWQLKRGITDRISNETVDTLYEKARRAGADGGKLLGAGGGGFLLLYAEPDAAASVRRALAPLIEVPFAFEQSGSCLLFQNGTDRI